jgi:hypothetical protein
MKKIIRRVIKMNLINKKALFMLFFMLLAGDVFGADGFRQKVSDFISDDVLIWTRILGALSLIGGIIGVALKNQDKNEKLSQIWHIVGITAVVFGIPEIINLLFSSFSSSTIDALQ